MADNARPCPGCGYYFIVNESHREDCTANISTHDQALINVINIIGVERVL